MLLSFYYLLAVFITFCMVLIFSNLNVSILILKDDEREEVVITTWAFYGLLRYRLELPFLKLFSRGKVIDDLNVNSDFQMRDQELIKDQKERDFTINQIKKIYQNVNIVYRRYKNTFTYIHQKIIFDEIEWKTVVGSGDAAVTAITIGLFWTLKSNLISYMNRKVELKEINLNVVPCYQGKKFNTSFNCIFKLKMGYIIIAALKILYRKIKGW